jgi:hypothetical protein
METNYKKFRKVPPYMTKTGVQIGLLYQEPFEVHMDKDAYRLQRALLSERYKSVNRMYMTIDAFIVVLSVITLFGIILGGIYGFF